MITITPPGDYKNKIRKIEQSSTTEYQWSIQWDDRLNAFYVFLFPTPIIGIKLVKNSQEEQELKIFPVAGNAFLQRMATKLIVDILQEKK
jgi:hypothetical protein